MFLVPLLTGESDVLCLKCGFFAYIGIAAIYVAAQNGHPDIVQALIEAGANVDQIRLSDLTTPLMRASYNGHPFVVDLLTAAGADMEMRDSNGYTAFQ